MPNVSQNVSLSAHFRLDCADGCRIVFKAEFRQIMKKSTPTKTFYAYMTSVTVSRLLFLRVLWLIVRH